MRWYDFPLLFLGGLKNAKIYVMLSEPADTEFDEEEPEEEFVYVQPLLPASSGTLFLFPSCTSEGREDRQLFCVADEGAHIYRQVQHLSFTGNVAVGEDICCLYAVFRVFCRFGNR